MRPTAHTVEALRQLARQGEMSLGIELHAMAARVRAAVGDLIGLSLAAIEDGVVLTLVASCEQIATLDAVQYLDGGPCVADLERTEPLGVNVERLLVEGRWGLYAQASAAKGVASSLSLPIIDGDRVIGGVNLYAAGSDAFSGRQEVAHAVGSEAALAVAHADLSSWTLRRSMEPLERVRACRDITTALGIISVAQTVTIPVAMERLRNAAARAGVSEAQAARDIRLARGR